MRPVATAASLRGCCTARGWRHRSCPSCNVQPGELCRTPTGREAGQPNTARLSYGRRELFTDDDVWQALEGRGASVVLVRFSGGEGTPGSIAAVTLEDVDKRELARWGHGEEELPEVLAAPIWGRYALFRGHPRITGLVMWDVQERQVVVAGERGGQKFDELLSAPRQSQPPKPPSPPPQTCRWSGAPMPAELRAEARFCSKRCRQASSRQALGAREVPR